MLSPTRKITSGIIDAYSNANYAFWDVYVIFSMDSLSKSAGYARVLLLLHSVFRNLCPFTGAYDLWDIATTGTWQPSSIANLDGELPGAVA
jgi:hypothetical protein